MAIKNFIPTVWSENLYSSLDNHYIAVKHCSREFEGDIKSCGSKVKICGVGDVAVYDYRNNTDLMDPSALSDTVTELEITEAKCFNFQIDDVDRVQSSPALMNAALKKAASALATQADRYVFSLADQASIKCQSEASTGAEIIDALLDVRTKLMENNVLDPEDLVIEVSPAVATKILKEKIAISSDNSDALEKGCVGNLFGCKIYVSNNITQIVDDSYTLHKCVVRSKRAIAFAEQLSEIEAYRPELRFADAVKGLYLYGAKVVYSNELASVSFNLYHNDYNYED